jgi:hypothetical protein
MDSADIAGDKATYCGLFQQLNEQGGFFGPA